MSDNTEQIPISDGQSVEVKAWLTRGDRRAIDKATRKGAFQAMGEISEVGIDVESLQDRAEQNPDLVTDSRNDDEEDAWLARCVVSGSMWDEKPTLEQVEALPDDDTEIILARMRALYKRTEDEVANLDGMQPSTQAVTGL